MAGCAATRAARAARAGPARLATRGDGYRGGAWPGQGYLLLAGADRERSQELRPRQGNQAEEF